MASRTLRFRMISLFCVVIGVFLAATYWIVYDTFSTQTRLFLDDRLSDSAKLLATQLAAQPTEARFAAVSRPGQYLDIIREDGAPSGGSKELEDAARSSGPLPSTGKPALRTTMFQGRSLRMAIVAYPIGAQHAWLILGEPMIGVQRAEANFRDRAVLLWAVSLLLTTFVAAWYVSRSLKPLARLSAHARFLTERVESAETDFKSRLPIANPDDELGQLAMSFNELFSRLDAAAQQLRQFVSDAAHELRTPLAVLHGETQLTLAQPRTESEYQDTLRTIDSELTAMVKIVEGLFTLSIADARQLRLQKEQLQLDEMFEEACGIATPVARKKNIEIKRGIWSEVAYFGDSSLLRQVCLILLENAVKYSPPNTTISVGIRQEEKVIELFVQDTGPGISPESLPHIFKRFFRAAPQGSEDLRSGGLGLAIAQAIMRVHEGQVRCESELGKGSLFTLTFPRSLPPSGEAEIASQTNYKSFVPLSAPAKTESS
jgi:heavy metal sensor kinase